MFFGTSHQTSQGPDQHLQLTTQEKNLDISNYKGRVFDVILDNPSLQRELIYQYLYFLLWIVIGESKYTRSHLASLDLFILIKESFISFWVIWINSYIYLHIYV